MTMGPGGSKPCEIKKANAAKERREEREGEAGRRRAVHLHRPRVLIQAIAAAHPPAALLEAGGGPLAPGPPSVPTCCCLEARLLTESWASPRRLPGNWVQEAAQRTGLQRACASMQEPRGSELGRRGSPWKLLAQGSWGWLWFPLWGTLQNLPRTFTPHARTKEDRHKRDGEMRTK